MRTSSGEDLGNTFRVLVATDCHLGFMEKDEVRRNDSFQAFEEICSIAEEKQVDFLLLGGDLFHENKPSRNTLVKTIEILRRYCLNDRPVQFQVVSDQIMNFTNIFGHVNYEDPHFNVGMPVFTIHGNHDDPAGVDNLSAVDILSSCNLVNYFGKMSLGGSGVGQITLYPILMRKGSTSIALYGLGNIRDERLNRMFQTPHAVQWMRPEAQEACDVSDWFNILVLHQNRTKANPKNAINEHFLPRFLDFIIWGHEHECLIDPQEVPGMGFHITQPGSSVATSLIEGEAKPKHVLLLEIKGNHYRPTKIQLMSVRPFEYADVILKNEADVDPNDQASIVAHLDTIVTSLISKANKMVDAKSCPKLPLVRVKVDYSGCITINPQRFGQKYVGKVANPQDILNFSKGVTRRQSVEEKNHNSDKLQPEELNQQNIEALVAECNLKMEILPVNDLDVALHDFVNKDDRLAFHSCLRHNLEETQKKISEESKNPSFDEGDLIVRVEQHMHERVKEKTLCHKENITFTCDSSFLLEKRGRNVSQAEDLCSFNDDEDTRWMSASSKPLNHSKKGMDKALRSVRDDSRGGRRGSTRRGRGFSDSFKQTTLEAAGRSIRSERCTSAFASSVRSTAAGSAEENANSVSSEENMANEETLGYEQIASHTGKKRAARGRGRGSKASAKHARTMEQSVISDFLRSKDDDEDDDVTNQFKKVQPRVTRNYGSLLRK